MAIPETRTGSLADASQQQPELENPLRRFALSALGGGVALAGYGGIVQAQAAKAAKAPPAKEEVFNAANRMTAFPEGRIDDGEPWVADQKGNFDLSDVRQAVLAKHKIMRNLVGARTYIPMFVRLVVGRENQPGGVLLGAAALFTWQLQVPNPAKFPNVPKGTVHMRSVYSSVYLDPKTMEPVKTLWNPFKKVEMKLHDLLFAENFLFFPLGGRRFVEEPEFSSDPPDVPVMPQFQTFGDELVHFGGGTYSNPGKHQPRFTENMWVSKMADVMDPAKSLIDMRYSFAGSNKAWEKAWTGFGMDDEDLLIDLAMGKKIHKLDDLPTVHRKFIADKYPERL